MYKHIRRIRCNNKRNLGHCRTDCSFAIEHCKVMITEKCVYTMV